MRGAWARWALLLLALLCALPACDATAPQADEMLVVEAFVHTGAPLPDVVVRQARPLSEPYAAAAAAVDDAEVQLWVEGQAVPYCRAAPGRYAPAAPILAPAGAQLTLRARWRAQTAEAATRLPPPIAIDSVRVRVPERPVRAIVRDSLRLDSLAVILEKGFIYPVEVTLWWNAAALDEAGADSVFWVRPQLKPRVPFSSAVTDLFLRADQVVRERTLPRTARGARSWTGVYAVPVAAETDPLPAHSLRVALLRSGRDYARFAASRADPLRREPVSNVVGGLGIVAGLTLDSLRLDVFPPP